MDSQPYELNHIGKSHKIIKIDNVDYYYILQDGFNLAFDPSQPAQVWVLQWLATLEDEPFLRMVDSAARYNEETRQQEHLSLNG